MLISRCYCLATITVLLSIGQAFVGEPKDVKPRFTFKGNEAGIRCLSFSPDAKMLVSKDSDGAVWLWDLTDGKANRMLGKALSKNVFEPVAFAPDSKKIVVAGDKIEVWDIDADKPKIALQKPMLSKFYVDFASSRVPMELKEDYLERAEPILFSPDGRLVARPAVGPGGKRVTVDSPVKRTMRRLHFHVWNLATGEPAAEDAANAQWLRAYFSPLKDSDIRRLHILHQTEGGSVRAVSADHRYVVSASQKARKKAEIAPSVGIWEVESEKLVASLPVDTKALIRSVAVSADGKFVAAGADDKIVRVWEVPGWKRTEPKKAYKKEYLEVDLGDKVMLKLVRIEPGKFIMGSPKSEQDQVINQWPTLGREGKGWVSREKQHEVEITKPFYMGIYTVTQAQYEKLIGKNPSAHSAASKEKSVAGMDTSLFPVERVSWDDAMEFCKKLSKKQGKTFDLPTEAEYEYACRAGTTTPFHFGKILTFDEANFDSMFPYGTNEEIPSLRRPTAVGSYPPNAWGLYDMHGNVDQWCKDWTGPYPAGPVRDPQGKEEKESTKGWTRILRGGSYRSAARASRSAYYNDALPTETVSTTGFRVVMRLP